MDGERTMLLFAIFGCFLIFLIAYTVGAMPATRARILTASPLILQQLGTWPGLETVVMGTGGEGGGFMTAGRGSFGKDTETGVRRWSRNSCQSSPSGYL
jgi:hypothetical protein